MKVLIIQLARFGDILQSAPAINALKRSADDVEVHVLVRERFAEAARFVKGVDHLHTWKTARVLGPGMRDSQSTVAMLGLFEAELDELNALKFDKIINISYSPFSSYLTYLLLGDDSSPLGYSRHRDGYLRIDDDTSRYFYTQVGIQRPNRAHLVDIFASTLDVQLKSEDKAVDPAWLDASVISKFSQLQLGRYIIIHVGTSDESKSVGPFKWKQIIRKINKSMPNTQILLVGVESEKSQSEKILEGELFDNVIDLVGKTKLTQVFALANSANMIVGADSLWMHIGSIVGVPCLNLSFESVNFWETGPWSYNSVVVVAEHEHSIPSDKIADSVIRLYNRQPTFNDNYSVQSTGVELYSRKDSHNSFQWRLIKSLYLSEDFPNSPSSQFSMAIIRLAELTSLALDNINVIKTKSGSLETASQILNNVDQLVSAVAEECKDIQPLVRWFQGNKSLIPPGTMPEIIADTEDAFMQLSGVLSLYLNEQAQRTKDTNHAKY